MLNEIRQFCIKSTKYHLNKSKETAINIETIKIKNFKKEENQLTLHYKNKIFNEEFLELFIDEARVKNIEIKHHDEQKKILIYIINDTIINKIYDKSQLKLQSDLTFLIQRVLDWFKNENNKIIPPNEKCTNLNIDKFNLPYLSNRQKTAVNTALSNNFSYVWGPPGSGKTQSVIAESITQYSTKNKKILILAPTNSSLDNVLLNFLPKVSDFINEDEVIRLGYPTKPLMNRYPDVCEKQALAAKISKLKRSKKNIEKILVLRTCNNENKQINEILDDFSNVDLEETDFSNSFEIKQIDEEIKYWKSRMYSKRKWVSEYKINHEVALLEKKKTGLLKQNAIKSFENKYLAKFKKFIEKYITLKIFNTDIKKYSNYIKEELNSKLKDNRNMLIFHKSLIKMYDKNSSEELKKSLYEINDKINNINNRKTEIYRDYKIICSTTDTILGRFSNEKNLFTHTFIDEASFVPMIKVIPIIGLTKKLTLIGDHYQIPPVFKNDKKDQNYEDLCSMWRLPAFNVKQLFEKKCFDKLKKGDVNSFTSSNSIKSFFLNETYRFGQDLADILDEKIYKNKRIKSKLDSVFKIYFINAPKTDFSEKRSNINEIEKIVEFIEKYNPEDFAVITPYTTQRDKLYKNIETFTDNIYTIHSAQGKEWSNVIFSVADTFGEKFYTNSDLVEKNSHKILNTALSRAKKNLIIVCDYQSWKDRNQLISKILEIATELRF